MAEHLSALSLGVCEKNLLVVRAVFTKSEPWSVPSTLLLTGEMGGLALNWAPKHPVFLRLLFHARCRLVRHGPASNFAPDRTCLSRCFKSLRASRHPAVLHTGSHTMTSYNVRELTKIGVPFEKALQIQTSIKTVSYSSGSVIWPSEGQVDGLCMVIEGIVAANAPMRSSIAASSSMSIYVYGPLMWFGEESIINRKPTYLEYVCLNDVELIMIPEPITRNLFSTELAFSNHMCELMAWRLKKQSDILSMMRLGSSPLRVVTGIALFAESLAYSGKRPPTIGMANTLAIPIKQSVFASLCGVSRTLFSEYILQLERAGWLEIMYGKIEIKGMETWRRFINAQARTVWSDANPSIEKLIDVLNELSRKHGQL